MLALSAVFISHPVLAQNEDEKMVIVSTFAGNSEHGIADGEASAAQFFYPTGIAIDAAGTLYVVDWGSDRIRKITPKGEVSTLAGSEEGFADGQGSAARFSHPFGIAIDAEGNLYVADSGNNRIRKITPEGEVSTLAGSGKLFAVGSFADGQGNAARFKWPLGIAIDMAGNLYVADTFNNRIRKVTLKGEVSTLAGSEQGFSDGQGSTAQFNSPSSIAVDTAGNLYVADSTNNSIRKIVIKRP